MWMYPIVVLGSAHVLNLTSQSMQFDDVGGFSDSSVHSVVIVQGVPPSHIYKEWASYDTIANAYFALVWHTIPRQWRNLLVLTSDFHMPRSALAFAWLFSLQGATLPSPAPASQVDSPPLTSSGSSTDSDRADDDSDSISSGAGSPTLATSAQHSTSSGRRWGDVSSNLPPLASHLRTWREYKLSEDCEDELAGRLTAQWSENGYDLRFISALDHGMDEEMVKVSSPHGKHKAGSVQCKRRVLLSFPCVAHCYSPHIDEFWSSLQARRVKELGSTSLQREKMARYSSMEEFHHYFHTEHRAYNVEHQHEFGKWPPNWNPEKMCY